MRILLFSIKIFCIYSEQSRGLILALGDGCSSSQSQRSTLVSYSEPLSKNPKNLKQKDVLFLSNDSFQELEVLFPRCWRRTFCLLLLLFNWWAFIFLWMWKNVVELSRLDGMWVVLCLVLLSSALKKNTFFVNRFIPISQYWNISHSSFCFLNKDTPVIK